jgi:catalase
MTRATGAPVADNLNIHDCGPAPLQDIWLVEKMAHFDREVIPERRMHAKGWGAYGTLHRHSRHHPLHEGEDLLGSRQAHADVL